ncbi:hypothetical protein KGF54_005084 [Candida jiufengensis]|uniref:uncharacterized protein n=1 Tax=Candida jiufengensis TaxID=497108 RepID=UPI00222545B5|nr:uncharacterized protein KGF54_005084 [Candida jiufengensis]KAI5952009.1 hypothetical protein KGF54_005084 [Candida jiufengensis]
MRAEVRRCRRCKRKRIDDEPSEVKQYKTCAKCRIIERNKKNSRKPLAEETMLYGLKQFREQQSTENYIEEEGLLKDEFFKRYHNKPFSYDIEIRKVLSNPNYVPPVIVNTTDEIVVPAETLSPGGTRYQMTLKPIDSQAPLKLKIERVKKPKPASISKPSQSKINKYHQSHQQHVHHQQQHQQQQQQQQQRSSHSQQISTQTKLLPSISDTQARGQKFTLLNDEDELNAFKEELRALGNDSTKNSENFNPYLYSNVYSDLEPFLLKIIDSNHKKENFNNLVLLKEFDLKFCNEISDNSFDEGIKLNTQIFKSNEKQSRINLIKNLQLLYIDPIIASLQLDFEQKSTNLHDYKYSNNIRSYYQYRDIPKSSEINQELKNSSISLSFNKKFQILTIKVNYEINIQEIMDYSPQFKNVIYNILKNFAQSGNEIIFDQIHGSKVYEQLKSNFETYNSDLQSSIKTLIKDKFVKDFINFEKDMKVIKEEEQEEMEIDNYDEDEEGNDEDEEEEEGEEGYEDDEESLVQDKVVEEINKEIEKGDDNSNKNNTESDTNIDGNYGNLLINNPEINISRNNNLNENEFTKKETTAEIVDPIFKP